MKYLAQTGFWRFDQLQRSRMLTSDGKSRVLGHFRQVFPLRLFPDELIVEELRIVHLKNNGPWSKVVSSIMTTDIACVNASSGLFFGHIHIQSLTGGPEILVDNLARGDVFRIRSLVEGIALAAREGLRIDQSDIEKESRGLMMAGSALAS